jgi:hypothetical protein
MKTKSGVIFLATIGLTSALVVGSGVEGCRSDMGGIGGSGASGNTATASHGVGSGGMPAGAPVTIQQITDKGATGYVGPGTPVTVKGAVAMSVKFLVSKSSSSGSCLWGVFLSAPGLTETGPNTGVLAVSYGTPASAVDGGKAYCPDILPHAPAAGQPVGPGDPAGDSFPDDVQPGDVLDVVGVTDAYIPATCTAADAGAGASMVPGIQLAKVTLVTRTAKMGPVPKAHVFDSTNPTDMASITKLAAGSDPMWLAQWGGVLIELDNMTAVNQQGALTDSYGHMLLAVQGQYGIEVGDKLYYDGLAKYVDACHSGPYYMSMPPITLNKVTGFVYLDFCNWSLAPASKCADLAPPSNDCAAYADAGPDADPSMVCLH